MNPLPPFETLYDVTPGSDIPLPETLAALYGRLGFPSHADRPHIISNFVSSLDGVVSLGLKDRTDGDLVSGNNQHDSMLMALLRAACDAVIVGAGSLRKSSQHVWTAEHVYPSLTDSFKQLRQLLKLEPVPLNIFITGSGNIDPGLPVFHADGVPVAIITTLQGAKEINRRGMPGHVQVIAPSSAPYLTVQEMLRGVRGLLPQCKMVMMEGGPHLLGEFFAEGCLDELFLTLAPQIAGRGGNLVRMGLVADKVFAPDHSVWGKLVSLKRAGEHLFLRYAFNAAAR